MSKLLNRTNGTGVTACGCGTAEVARVAAAGALSGRRAAVLPGTWRYCIYGTSRQPAVVFVLAVYQGRGGVYGEKAVGKMQVIKPNGFTGRTRGGPDSRAGWTKVLCLAAADVVADAAPTAEEIAAIVAEIGEPPVRELK